MISLELVRQCLKGRCQGNQVLLILMHEFRWMQAASGTAGWANIGLCSASSSATVFLWMEPCCLRYVYQ